MKIVNVFRTSVKNKKDIKLLATHLENIPEISHWNFDLVDYNSILRVVSEMDIKKEVIGVLRKRNFDCEELPD